MFGENKNIKDSSNSSNTNYQISAQKMSSFDSLKDIKISYTKTNKLVTAMYMVTDIMDKSEPIRNKLRTLSIEILSDIDSENRFILSKKVAIVLELLDMSLTLNMISIMNKNILSREFLDLKKALLTPKQNEFSLEGFLVEEDQFPINNIKEINTQNNSLIYKGHHKGHIKSTNLGVQKGSTLMKAISDKTFTIQHSDSFDMLKKERRFEIVKIIKNIKDTNPKAGGATIKDIKEAKNPVLKSCSEKTLQRELISMVKDHVLNKIGEKRWSKYSLK